MKELITIDTEEIMNFFFQELIQRGHVPEEEELEVLADIMFDFLLDKGVIEEDGE